MVRHLDLSIGRVLEAIEACGNADNTLVVFTSDNGSERFSYMWPFVGEKGDLCSSSNSPLFPIHDRHPFRSDSATLFAC